MSKKCHCIGAGSLDKLSMPLLNDFLLSNHVIDRVQPTSPATAEAILNNLIKAFS